ncbi:hypothetical protein TPHA_0E04070 [Tetrapisispora phaffii CBS 4417]|uniref:Homeobox domain-containing protein n=1 Tax=Tetrapisispora phaffii (strain ATCC 24235 / CBS 4417 / NBRC 1672 / NRRL Y-8282 / UCD 70-5) TaxID=1071381 RepID=G8BUB6_TETPH|nr:hypothetical protein TPHA_0E03610 [Tetrapisispora phaffii CBS 4417]XP_003685928.1 hypothetical protein TPHA_0E04070 [Tetrapisispora phaffii CBS 4417]CCE63450.1 hypothetical protein TPHA_0E03610 [Tetrapisispora phaffii CBS 4417]CCE63494.1 hypothetical protein TPHA_0E04070 [Tetrapisispora phaffii CBS 4417]
MNKIPINKLLNPSQHYNLTEKLQQINITLSNLCTKLPDTITDLTEADHRELQDILLYLTTVVKQQELKKEEIMLVKTTYQLCTTLTLMVKSCKQENDKENKENEIIKYESGTSDNSETNSSCNSSDNEDKNSILVFNVITQDMMNNNKKNNKSYRGHRLPKKNVQYLEDWYMDHRKNPYLNEINIKLLMSKTSLSRIQVKNWISNRRRKEKSITISPEVSALLRDNKTITS